MSKKLEDYVVTIPDFPEPGIMFRDITSVIQDPDGLIFLHAHTVGEGNYRVILSSDEKRFGGPGIIDHDYIYHTEYTEGRGLGFDVYSPCRTAMVLEKTED